LLRALSNLALNVSREHHLLPLAAVTVLALTSYTFTQLVPVSRGQPGISFFEVFIYYNISRNMATFNKTDDYKIVRAMHYGLKCRAKSFWNISVPEILTINSCEVLKIITFSDILCSFSGKLKTK